MEDNAWDTQKIPQAHSIGVNAVSWAPAVSPGSLLNSAAPTAPPVKRLVSGGCDNLVKTWKYVKMIVSLLLWLTRRLLYYHKVSTDHV